MQLKAIQRNLLEHTQFTFPDVLVHVKVTTELYLSLYAFNFATLKNGSWKKSSLTTVTTSFPHSAAISVEI